MKVEIIAVGNEVIYGHTVNTNASYLAKQVQLIGLVPSYMGAISDDPNKIKEALNVALQRSELIIFTGGLGAALDELKKEEIFLKEATILENDCGTVPGYLLEVQGKVVILLPGSPREMEMMFSKYTLPLLKKRTSAIIKHLDIKCFGIDERELAHQIDPLLGNHEGVNVSTYINEGEVLVRITVHDEMEEKAVKMIEQIKNKIEACLEPYIFGYNEDKLEENLMQLLLERHMTVATVESCTGGLIAATLINYSGASACFNEGIITYSNEAKMKYVDVSAETLKSVGAVSEETAREMAEGIRKRAHVDIGLSSTGIAGPGGGTPSKPVGLVYVGIATAQGTEVFKLQLSGSRQEVRQKTVKHILFQLYKHLK